MLDYIHEHLKEGCRRSGLRRMTRGFLWSFCGHKKKWTRIAVKYGLKQRQIINRHFNIDKLYLYAGSGSDFWQKFHLFSSWVWKDKREPAGLQWSPFRGWTLVTSGLAHSCTYPLQLLRLFCSNSWLNSSYLQCRTARGVQGKKEHCILLVYSIDLRFYFTWQEEAQKIKQAALGFDLLFFFFLFLMSWDTNVFQAVRFKHFYFKCHCLSLW